MLKSQKKRLKLFLKKFPSWTFRNNVESETVLYLTNGRKEPIKYCQICPSKVRCYKERAKSKTYSTPLKSDEHLFQKRFQKTAYFKEKTRHRYKIEAKNAELKYRHGIDVARASGLFNMELQAGTTIFVVKWLIWRGL